MRKDFSKQIMDDHKLQMTPPMPIESKEKALMTKKNISLMNMAKPETKTFLPPLQKVPLTKQRLASRQSEKAGELNKTAPEVA